VWPSRWSARLTDYLAASTRDLLPPLVVHHDPGLGTVLTSPPTTR
jgi:hypothetical protein